MSNLLASFLVSFGVIFVAELGDKSQLMALAFATRYKTTPGADRHHAGDRVGAPGVGRGGRCPGGGAAHAADHHRRRAGVRRVRVCGRCVATS